MEVDILSFTYFMLALQSLQKKLRITFKQKRCTSAFYAYTSSLLISILLQVVYACCVDLTHTALMNFPFISLF